MADSKNRLAEGLGKIPAQPPIIKKAPTTYRLSTQTSTEPETQDSEITISQERTNALVRDSENAPATTSAPAPAKEPERVSRGYKLREDFIKRLKFIALKQDRHLYEVMEDAMEQYIERNEIEN